MAYSPNYSFKGNHNRTDYGPLNSGVRPNMRKELLNAWRDAVTESMAFSLPQFVLHNARRPGAERGMLCYSWAPTPSKKFTCFLVFRPIASEGFDTWAGWSIDGKLPYGLESVSSDPEDFAASHFVLSTLELAGRSGLVGWSFWEPSDAAIDDPGRFAQEYAEHFSKALSDSDAANLVRPAVAFAMAEIEGYCLPYFNKRAAAERL